VSGLLVAGLWVEVEPDDIAGIGDKPAPNHLKQFLACRGAEVDFVVDIVIGDRRQQVRKAERRFPDRFDYHAAGFFANVYRLVERKLGRFHHGGGNANRGAVTPFFDQNLHLRPDINNVDT